jgi:hypothetical protein
MSDLEAGWTKATIKVIDLEPGHIVHPNDTFGAVLEREQKGDLLFVTTLNRAFNAWPVTSDIDIEVPLPTDRS